MKGIDVVIHIGAPKSGSSALQSFCIKNQNNLLVSGFYYPDHPLDRNGISGGHSQLAVPLIENDLAKARNTFNRLLKEARDNHSCLLLSAEGFYGQFNSFSPLLEGLNVKVVGWFRHPFEAFISNYNQSVKRHYQTHSLNKVFSTELFKSQQSHLNGTYFHHWASAIGKENCVFLPYLYSLNNDVEPIELIFLKILGVSRWRLRRFKAKPKSVNKSYLPEALELKRLLNFVLSDENRPLSHQVDWAMQHYSDCSQFEGNDSILEMLDPEKVKVVLNYFRDSNLGLAESFPEMNALFLLENKFLEQAGHARSSGLNLLLPWHHLLKEYPDAAHQIRELVSAKLYSPIRPTHVLLRLADLIGLPYEEPDALVDLLPDRICDVITSEDSQPADLLREVALMLEHYGDYRNAMRVIVRALVLRPNGPAILAAHERLTKKLETARYD